MPVVAGNRGDSACSNALHGSRWLSWTSGWRKSIWFSRRERNSSSAGNCSAAGRRVRMGENCQKPGRSVTKTGNSSTPITQMKPCNGCGLGVFQGRRINVEEYLLISQPGIDRVIINTTHFFIGLMKCFEKFNPWQANEIYFMTFFLISNDVFVIFFEKTNTLKSSNTSTDGAAK
ncbi:hypothetical protein [Xanthomonas oryzae]|uniref:hypothetical protein n=1 Tax=Xanthomonas oryzae TaxID=347 RepID=UPI001F5EF6C1|nr:hypothetical protein [Xanthomonas oryzae]